MVISRHKRDPEIFNYILDIFQNCKEHLNTIEPIFYGIYTRIDKNNINNHNLLFKYELFLKEAYETVVTDL